MTLTVNKPLKAYWIWKKQPYYNIYNQTILATKSFSVESFSKALMRITADSYYRLYVNDIWVNDGHFRIWPEHFQYDEIDVTDFLQAGNNTIKIIARYYGTGTHHQIPKQAGLLVQLELMLSDDSVKTIISDDSWEVAEAKQWVSNTPKISFIMEPAECYDARLENSEPSEKAQILYDAYNGPWQDLNPRDIALLTKKDFMLASFCGANVVKADGINFCLAAAQLINPGLIEANVTVGLPCGMASVITVDEQTIVKIKESEFKVAIDGHYNLDGIYNLSPGKHLALAFVSNMKGVNKERTLRIEGITSEHFENPLDNRYENPWCFIAMDEFKFVKDDLRWIQFKIIDRDIIRKTEDYNKLVDEFLQGISDLESFVRKIQSRCRLIPYDNMFFKDNDWKFQERKVISDAVDLVVNPLALMKKDESETVVRPTDNGDVELCYDLGEQNCGYYSFEFETDENIEIDINGIEYIGDNDRLQHTTGFRNSLAYITKQGFNRFTTLKRYSGRYIFITFRNQKTPVKIRSFNLVESTYPTKNIGRFDCSNQDLRHIWDISVRTLKLCMEDVFVDCPLYEQTFWVGDARNESLFAYLAFDATDIARRCIKLASQSLEHFPVVSCQAPSSWQSIIPAWSFLWGISIWDYYEYSGDIDFISQMYNTVIENLKGAQKYINSDGIFSCTFWNFFDWAKIDWIQKDAVLHNSMLLVGAIDAAVNCARVIGDNKTTAWLEQLRQQLCGSINRLWDTEKKSYPDSIQDDGTASESTCQHTSVLSVLYDIVEPSNRKYAIENMINPSNEMVKIGSPFAIFYLYQALEKVGREDDIINSILVNYLPMLEAGSTTVWESFATGTLGGDEFPTRSHCHAWSSAPIYFFSRTILGIKQIEPGARSFKISPRLSGLSWAKGSVATVKGPVDVSWSLKDGQLNINYSGPPDVYVEFERNDTHANMCISVNNTRID